MADKKFEIAVILSAYDKISAIVATTVSKYGAQMKKMAEMSKQMSDSSYAYGRKSITTGVAAAAPVIAMAKAYGDQEEALLRMKATMMKDGGIINQKEFDKLKDFARKTSEQFTGTTEDYLKMITVLKQNSIKPNEILGGIGTSVAQLAVFFKMAPDSVAQFAARMKQDMGIMPKEMLGMMDLVSRLHNVGVGKDGAEAVNEMAEAYSKAGLGAHNLGANGLQAAKDLGVLMSIFIRRGISGATVGTNFRRIFDGLRDADKLKKVNDAAKQYGITLDFFDKAHQFKGFAAMAGELSKLQGLNSSQISGVLKAFGGKQGLSTEFIEFLGKEGVSSFNDLSEKASKYATLQKQLGVILGGVNAQAEIARTTGINTAADIGETYSPDVKDLARNFNTLFKSTSEFVKTHKTLVADVAKAVAYFAAYKIVVGSLALVWGTLTGAFAASIAIIKGVNFGLFAMRYRLIYSVWPALVSATTAVWSFTAALLANPITWIVAGVIALAVAAYLIYKNWKPISKWFADQWVSIKAQVSGAIAVFTLFKDVVVGIGKSIIGAFSFNPKLFTEGVVQAANAVEKIRHGGISKAYNQAYNDSIKLSVNKGSSGGSNIKPNTSKPGTTINNHFSPVIHLSGTASPKDGQSIADQLKPHFDKWFRENKQNQLRTSY